MPGGGGTRVSLLTGGQRPPGPDGIGRWGMGDDAWRGQKERSVESWARKPAVYCRDPARPAQLAAFHVNPSPTPQPVDAARANKP